MAVRALERAYRANIRYADAGIGVLLETLRREGLYRESLVILTSDHGEAFNGHGYTSHNTTLYDDMTRIPLLMKFPRADAITPGRVRALTESIDLAPTILDYLGLPAPAHFEGDSLLALARGEFTSLAGPEVVTSTVDQSFHAIRLGPHKYIMGRDGSEELFDLERDPGERHDRIESDRALATSLRNMLTAIVERHSGKEPPAENTLRTDPAMVRLLEKLGYVDANASE